MPKTSTTDFKNQPVKLFDCSSLKTLRPEISNS